MKSVLGIREFSTINRIIQVMQDKKIGGELLVGGALLWNEKARIICEEGYLNYVNRLKLEENEEKEFKKLIKDNIIRGASLNQQIVNVDNISMIDGNNYGEVKQADHQTINKSKARKFAGVTLIFC